MPNTATTTLAPPAPEARPTAPDRRVVFALVADADPGTLPRVLELVAKRGLVPDALTSRLNDDTLAIEMAVVGMARGESDHVANCLRQIPMVAHVTVTEGVADGVTARADADADADRLVAAE